MEMKEKLHALRLDLKEAKISRVNKADRIREMNEKIQAKKNEQVAQLKDKRLRLSSNKDKREHYGYTNQKDWNTFINNTLTNEDENKINRAYTEGLAVIESCKKEVKFLNIKIADLEWQLRIELTSDVEFEYGTEEQVTIPAE